MIIPGKKFACSICDTIFEGGNCRNLATRCYESHQRQNLKDEVLMNHFPNPHEKLKPGEGVDYLNRWHNWRRLTFGSKNYNRLQIGRSACRVEQYLYSLITRKPHVWKTKISSLQRLSYAFHYQGFEGVKQAAYALAYSEAVQKRLDDLNIPELIRSLLSLDKLLPELMSDFDFARYIESKQDIDAFLARLSTIDFIEGLDLDDFNPQGDEGDK